MLQMPDGRLHCLPAFEPVSLLGGQALELAPVDDLNARVVRIHAPEAQVYDHLLGLGPSVLGQDGGLLQLLVQRVAVVWVAREAARSHHQALFVRDSDTDLHAELVRFPGLAFADAFHLGGVQGIQLVLVLGPLAADALSALHQRLQVCQRRCCGLAGLPYLALHLAQHDAQDRALALEHFAQSLELLGVGVAAGTPAQALAFLDEGLLERNTSPLGAGHHLVASDLQQARIHRVGDGLLLHRGVHDQPLKLGWPDGLGGNSCVNGGFEQFFHAGLTQTQAKAPDLRGIAGQAGLVVRHAAEVLPHDVLGPALHQFFIAELEGVLEVQQADHQAHRKTGTTGGGNAATGHLYGWAEQVVLRNGPARAHLAGKAWGQRRLDLCPGQSAGQHRQWVAWIDHLGQWLAEEVGLGHLKNSQESESDVQILWRSRTQRNWCKPNVHAGCRGFAGPTGYRRR